MTNLCTMYVHKPEGVCLRFFACSCSFGMIADRDLYHCLHACFLLVPSFSRCWFQCMLDCSGIRALANAQPAYLLGTVTKISLNGLRQGGIDHAISKQG